MEYILIGLVLVAVLFVVAINMAQAGTLPRPGARAPEFSLPSSTGVAHSIPREAGASDAWTVLFFFPADDTPECESAVKTLIEERGNFAGAAVWLVSVNDSSASGAYAAARSIALPMLADKDGSVAKRFGTLTNIAGFKFARKALVVINPQSVVTYAEAITENQNIRAAAQAYSASRA
jgi:thioredoxin-dependent peroxiredoxin